MGRGSSKAGGGSAGGTTISGNKYTVNSSGNKVFTIDGKKREMWGGKLNDPKAVRDYEKKAHAQMRRFDPDDGRREISVKTPNGTTMTARVTREVVMDRSSGFEKPKFTQYHVHINDGLGTGRDFWMGSHRSFSAALDAVADGLEVPRLKKRK